VNPESPKRTAPPINGHMIDLGAGRSIAIYERTGEWCVAEFCDDRGDLMHADTWFRFHARALRHYRNRREALRSSMPLTPEMLQKIERLHRESESRQQRMPAMPWNVAKAVKRCLIRLTRRTVG
jgi:hypothetical protein